MLGNICQCQMDVRYSSWMSITANDASLFLDHVYWIRSYVGAAYIQPVSFYSIMTLPFVVQSWLLSLRQLGYEQCLLVVILVWHEYHHQWLLSIPWPSILHLSLSLGRLGTISHVSLQGPVVGPFVCINPEYVVLRVNCWLAARSVEVFGVGVPYVVDT